MPCSGPVRLFCLVALAALAAAPCGSEDDPSDSMTDLGGTSWSMTTWTDERGTKRPAGGSDPVIDFGAGGKLAGNTGCNSFSGTWEGAEGDLTIETGPLTAMACPPDLEAQEDAVVAALAATTGYATENDTLELLDADGNASLGYVAESDDLAGSSWTATGINNGSGGVGSNSDTSKVTARFAEDGTLSGSAGCNTYSATWTTDGSDPDDSDPDDASSGGGAPISFGGPTVTEMSCGPELDALEQQYLAALDAATTYAARGATLELRDDSGTLQVGFSRAE